MLGPELLVPAFKVPLPSLYTLRGEAYVQVSRALIDRLRRLRDVVTFARARINKVSIRKERSKANKAAYALARKINFAADLEQVQLRHDPRARERYYI